MKKKESKIERKYLIFFNIYYGLVLLTTIGNLYAVLVEKLTFTQIYNMEYPAGAYIGMSIFVLIFLLSIVSVILTHRKHLPKITLVYPVYRIAAFIIWSNIIPFLVGYYASGDSFFIIMENLSKFDLVFYAFDLIFPSFMLFRLNIRK